MPVIMHKTHGQEPASFRIIILLSAWGFVLVVASFLFLGLGYMLDEMLGTSPKFMLALLFLAIIGCLIELYQEAWKIIKSGGDTSHGKHRG